MFALIFLLAATSAASPTEGILVGISHGLKPEHAAKTEFVPRTETWLATDLGLVRLGPDLAVPRENGWYRLRSALRTTRADDMTTTYETLVLEPATKPRPPRMKVRKPRPTRPAQVEEPATEDWPPRKKKHAEDDEASRGHYDNETETVSFVNEKFVTILTIGDGYDGGEPLNGESVRTVRVTSSGLGRPSLDIGNVLGKSSKDELVRPGGQGETSQKEDRGDDEDSCDGYRPAKSDAWGFEHAEGRWKVMGSRESTSASEPPNCTFDLPEEAPSAIVGWQPPLREWSGVVKELVTAWSQLPAAPGEPEVDDVVTSPSGHLELVVGEDGLTLLSRGIIVGHADVNEPRVVMVEPVEGRANVARWRVEAAAALR